MKDTEQLETLLRSFYLASFVRNYKDFARKAERQKLGHIAYLHELAQAEATERQTRRTERLINQAKLLHGKTLGNFDFSRQPSLSPTRVKELAEGDLLDRCENVLIFGIPGAGKSHLASALGREWCLRGRRVLFTTAAMLVQELLVAKRDLYLQQLIKKLDRYEAQIIDDISYIPFNRDETDVLFVLLSERYETRSVVVTSNLVFSEWSTIFRDPMTTRAAIDRLVHHATILELKESYRQAEANRRKKAQEERAPVGD
ncbi:MAG TPA: IS21-like element helper ATPase IstB [Candidatus Obscuribacterales bacterium]